jgi:hypothetical protein
MGNIRTCRSAEETTSIQARVGMEDKRAMRAQSTWMMYGKAQRIDDLVWFYFGPS